MRPADLDAAIGFLCEADRLKSVRRANVLMDLSRPENSAEHSWHVALLALLCGAGDRAIAMILLHDLVEIDTGDQPIHLDHDAPALAAAEDRAAARLFGMAPGGDALAALWRVFEAHGDADAVLAKRMDHVQPIFQVLLSPRPIPDHVAIVRDNLDRGRAARMASEWPDAVDAARALMRGDRPAGPIAPALALMAEADRLKSVLRASRLIDNSRRENSAEHSWHLGLYALVLAPLAGPGVDVGRVIRMLLIHDLVEIDVGDVPLHAANGTAHAAPERQAAEDRAARRLFGLLPPAQGDGLLALWREFEAAQSPDAVFAKGLDRCQPAIQNLMGGGRGWVEFDVGLTQVQDRVGPAVRAASGPLWAWLDDRLQRHFAPA
ncbi:HD domain-containing protein [Paracoccus aestuarii]|uniref:HD domain-containing protein n=1 Tax=Paracoccus aestuarii TaxID=453842 RepID=UPI001F0B7968|nr:HD domain-containing protein [Paracoccus aestuarii]